MSCQHSSARDRVVWIRTSALSAEDWLHALINIDGLPASTREWRLITAKALTRLASLPN